MLTQRRILTYEGEDEVFIFSLLILLLRWAAEGLSFLTCDAEVKEKLVEDEPAMR